MSGQIQNSRSPRRKIIRGGQFTSKWKIGQFVQFDCDYNGIYRGVVVETSRTGVVIEVHSLGPWQTFFGKDRYQIECTDAQVEAWVR
jgi:hypothetical protein